VDACYKYVMDACYDAMYFWLFLEFFVLQWMVLPRENVF